jgi:hypothetical protein
MDGTLHAGSIHGHSGFRNSTARDFVVADLGVPCLADEDGAVRGCAVELAGAERAATNERLADDVVDDPDTIGIADEDRIDERIVDAVSLDGDVAVLEVILKALGALRRRHADIDGAQRAAAIRQFVGARYDLGETVVPERKVFDKTGLGPKADITPGLQRDARGIGELVDLNNGIRRLDRDVAACVKAASPDCRARADPAE